MEAEIRALLQEGGVSFKTNSKSFITSCPRCSKKDKLYVRRNDGKFVCWYCREIDGFQGQPEYALTELCGLPLREVRKRLYGDESSRPAALFLDLNLQDFEDDGDYMDLPSPLKPVAWPLDFLHLDQDAARPGAQYLEQRGIPVAVAREYGIRYHPAKQRVIFPVQHQGKLYGWQERLIANDRPYWNPRQQKLVTPLKVLTSPELQRDRTLMFMDRLEGARHCVLTEGPVDALKAHMCGGNVATMGKAVARSQLELIRNSGIQSLYLGLDPDAYLEVNRIRKLMTDVVLYDLRPPAPYKDLGEMPMEAVKALFDSAPELCSGDILVYLKNHFGA